MAVVNYKRLFEVQLLHEYYLTNSDETTVFHDPANKDAFISALFDQDAPSISSSLEYALPSALQRMIKSYQLHLVATYTGFALLTQVTEKTLDDGTTVYTPAVKLPDDASLPILVSLKNNLLSAVTNARFYKTIPAIFFFSNQDINTEKTFPALSAGVPSFDQAYPYEQGELYTDDGGKVCQYYLNGGKPAFISVEGKDYASASDELLVPLQFIYKFSNADKVTKARFDLGDPSGQQVRSYVFSSTDALQQLPLDFRTNQDQRLDPPPVKIVSLPQGSDPLKNIYTLTVTINDLKKYSHSLLFYEGDELSNAWGLVNITPVTKNPEYGLYAPDGYLKYRKNKDGTNVPAPVFEVRIKSRISYWRYRNDHQGKLAVSAAPQFLARSGTNDLVSLVPRPASALPRKYTIRDQNGTIKQEKYLPNPESDERFTIEAGTVYSDILVPKSDLFPLDNTS
jgi:hypothetical protein